MLNESILKDLNEYKLTKPVQELECVNNGVADFDCVFQNWCGDVYGSMYKGALFLIAWHLIYLYFADWFFNKIFKDKSRIDYWQWTLLRAWNMCVIGYLSVIIILTMVR